MNNNNLNNNNNNLDKRIVGGNQANILDIPHQALVLIDLDLDGRFDAFCGGSFVDDSLQFVLTAAHCLDYTAPHVWIGFGNSDAQQSARLSAETWKTVVHPTYDRKKQTGIDLGLIYLPQSLSEESSFDPTKVQAIALSNESPDIGEEVLVSGWGAIDEEGTEFDNIVRSVEIPIISRSSCGAPNGFFCAGVISDEVQDACLGDSGGPAISPTNELLGVVSYGSLVNENDSPCLGRGGYASVPYSRDWILSTINSIKQNPPSEQEESNYSSNKSNTLSPSLLSTILVFLFLSIILQFL